MCPAAGLQGKTENFIRASAEAFPLPSQCRPLRKVPQASSSSCSQRDRYCLPQLHLEALRRAGPGCRVQTSCGEPRLPSSAIKRCVALGDHVSSCAVMSPCPRTSRASSSSTLGRSPRSTGDSAVPECVRDRAGAAPGQRRRRPGRGAVQCGLEGRRPSCLSPSDDDWKPQPCPALGRTQRRAGSREVAPTRTSRNCW